MSDQTYLRAKIEITDVWGKSADAAQAREQLLAILQDDMDVNVVSCDVEVISQHEYDSQEYL